MLALTLTGLQKLELLPLEEGDGLLESQEILVRMDYAAVQPLDSDILSGRVLVETPRLMGTEGVGTVLQSRCKDFAVGGRVGFFFLRVPDDFGCWCTMLKLSPLRARIVELPPDVSLQEAAAGLVPSLTAAACLRHFDRGAVVLVPGACGAVGLALLQLAAARGMRAVGLVRGSARVAWLTRELHADAVDISLPGWEPLTAEMCGGDGADGVVDGVGGALLPTLLPLMRARGWLVRYGAVAGEPDAVALAAAVRHGGLRERAEGIAEALARPDLLAQLQSVMELMIAGTYRPRVWQAVDWKDAGEVLVPQPPWSKYVSQFTEGRIGRILLKFG